MLRLACVWALALGAFTGTVAPVRAQPEEGDVAPPEEAIRAYEQARGHYKAGRYPAAIEELERALSLDPDSPELLYNVARVYELMGDLGKAVEYYRRYRDMLPEDQAEERVRVDETLARLQGARQYVTAPQKEEPARPPAEPEPAPVPERGVADAAVWTTLAVSGSALVAGAVSGGMALKAEGDLADYVLGEDGGEGQREALAQKADRLALSSDVLLGAGAVAALTALVLYVARTEVSSTGSTVEGVRVLPSAGVAGAGLSLTGSF